MIRHRRRRSRKSLRFLTGLFIGGMIGLALGMLANPPFEGYFLKPPLYDDQRGLIFLSWLLFSFLGAVSGAGVGLLRKRD